MQDPGAARSAEAIDRFVIEVLGGKPGFSTARQRLDAEPEVGPAGLRRRGQPIERPRAIAAFPLRAAASTSSGNAHMETNGSNGSELASRAAAAASS